LLRAARPAVIGGLFAQHNGFFRPYTDLVFKSFFERTLEIDVPEQVASVIARLGGSADEYRRYLAGERAHRLDEVV